MYIFDPEIPKNMSSERIRKRKCPLHKIKMKVKTVKVEYGLPLFDRMVERPKDKFYPYCGAPVMEGCCMMIDEHGRIIDSTTKIWICPECVKEKRKYKKFTEFFNKLQNEQQ